MDVDFLANELANKGKQYITKDFKTIVTAIPFLREYCDKKEPYFDNDDYGGWGSLEPSGYMLYWYDGFGGEHLWFGGEYIIENSDHELIVSGALGLDNYYPFDDGYRPFYVLYKDKTYEVYASAKDVYENVDQSKVYLIL